MAGESNYMKYWGNHWRVRQSPKINFDLLKEDWDVYDLNIGDSATLAKNGDVSIRADYSYTGGVNRIKVKRGDDVLYEQYFDFLLRPSVSEIQKILESAGITDWKKYLISQ